MDPARIHKRQTFHPKPEASADSGKSYENLSDILQDIHILLAFIVAAFAKAP